MNSYALIDTYDERDKADRIKRQLSKALTEHSNAFRVFSDTDNGNLSAPVFEVGVIAASEAEAEAIAVKARDAINHYQFK